ncbi:STY0301 family protein [Saezia sanguinis]|uniref:STY0301 family protein n=1 Tax=Saezia sanguinis TaxID=1965230 RepID=UPI0030706C96
MTNMCVTRFAALAMVMFSGHALAEQTVVCPERVLLESATLSQNSVPAGFEQMVRQYPLRLRGVSIYDGHPQDNADLKPDDEMAQHPSWTLEGNYPEGKWLACNYGTGATKLIMRLDDASAYCTAVSEKGPIHEQINVTVTCR